MQIVNLHIPSALLKSDSSQYPASRFRSLLCFASHGRIRVMLKKRQPEGFTLTRLAGLCGVIAAGPSVDKAMADPARRLKLKWEALQVTPTTYRAQREHQRILKELTTRMVELLAISYLDCEVSPLKA